MKDVSIKAVVSGPNFFYREEHEWRGLDEGISKWLDHQERKLDGLITKALKDNKGGDLTVTFDMTRDGVPQKPMVITSVNRKDVVAIQRMLHTAGDELIGFAEGK